LIPSPGYKGPYDTVTFPVPRHLWSEVQRMARLTDTPVRLIVIRALTEYLRAQKAEARPALVNREFPRAGGAS
jgi:hypothetical protein